MSDLHLYPVNDAIDHYATRDCVCGPAVVGDLIVHRALQVEDDTEDARG